MISPFFPWFLAFLLLIACVALLVLLLRYRDRSVRLEAESRSWQERRRTEPRCSAGRKRC